MKKTWIYLLLCQAAWWSPPALAGERPDLWQFMLRAEDSYRMITDYTCNLHRTELIGDKYKVQRNILVKFKKPGSFYLKWTEGQGKGSESLYIKGQNGGKMLVHLPGLYKFVCFSMAPNGKRALKNNRHTIDQLHFGFFIDMVKQNLILARDDSTATIRFNGEELMGGVPTIGFTGEFGSGKGYYGKRVLINIAKDNCLPVKIDVFGENDRLLESYYFTDIVLNAGLKDSEFSQDNPEYGFKKRKVYALD